MAPVAVVTSPVVPEVAKLWSSTSTSSEWSNNMMISAAAAPDAAESELSWVDKEVSTSPEEEDNASEADGVGMEDGLLLRVLVMIPARFFFSLGRTLLRTTVFSFWRLVLVFFGRFCCSSLCFSSMSLLGLDDDDGGGSSALLVLEMATASALAVSDTERTC